MRHVGVMGRNMSSMRFVIAAVVALLLAACGGRPTAVSPNEIPALEAQLADDPDNADALLRYSAALFSAGRCDTASTVAARGAQLKPESSISTLVLGQCLEQDDDYDGAIEVYRAYLTAFPSERGAGAVRAREMLVRRDRATSMARTALAQEAELADRPSDPRTLAVLPVDIAGDSVYQPLGRGLAQVFTADLALMQAFTLVERVQVQALIEEMRLGATDRVEQQTAARMGRMLAAGRMVQGAAAIPDEDDVQLSMAVIDDRGEVANPSQRSGQLRNILEMEKEIVIELAAQLGYQLSQAERQAILENGTQDLVAMLAYSNGLVAEDIGDFSLAATYYQQAVQRDPGFQQARSRYQASAAAPAVQAAAPGQVTTISAEAVQQPDMIGQPVADAMATSVADVAATISESTAGASTGTTSTQTTQQATTTPKANPDPIVVVTGVGQGVSGVIRVIFRLP